MGAWKVKSWRLRKSFVAFVSHINAWLSRPASCTGVPPLNPFLPRQLELKVHFSDGKSVNKFISPEKPLQSFKVPLFWGCKNRKHNFETWLSALHDEMQVLQRQGTSPKDWRLIEDLWGAKASRRWGLEGLLSVPCFFGDLVKDLKVSKPTIKMLALVFLRSCCILQSESLQNFLSGVHFLKHENSQRRVAHQPPRQDTELFGSH